MSCARTALGARRAHVGCAATRRVLLEAIAANVAWARDVVAGYSCNHPCVYLLAMMVPRASLRGAEVIPRLDSGTSLIAVVETRPVDPHLHTCDLIKEWVLSGFEMAHREGLRSTFEVATVFCRRPTIDSMVSLAQRAGVKDMDLVRITVANAIIVRTYWEEAKRPQTSTVGRRLSWPVWEHIIAMWLGVPRWWFCREFWGT